MTTATLLIELFTEELPPKALKALGEAFATSLRQSLAKGDFLEASSGMTPYATPRRLAAQFTQVRHVSPDFDETVKLMPVAVAFGADGSATTALQKRLAALGIDAAEVPQLERRMDGKAEALFFTRRVKGTALASCVDAALHAAIEQLPIPKVMSYAGAGGYYNDVRFVRPAHRLVALHGNAILPVRALHLIAGRITEGHRFASRGELELPNAESYAPMLEAEGKVQPSFAVRRETIAAALKAAADGAQVIMPDALLDEVTALVEWPAVYAGTFDAAFLDVPQECLILTMQHNQKYFALADANGRLTNRFLLVSNIATRHPDDIVHGNERVLRARLADAKFFYDFDRRQPLAARAARLDAVVYHNKLGTQGARIERLRTLARQLAPLIGAAAPAADRAALLAKADLVTDMVGEFPELQGTMGRYYALHDGEPPDVADAIAEHYAPRFAGDALPAGPVAQTVALADKLEALAGLFGIGQLPTGDKDPFGLRRAALGVIRILIEREHRVPLSTLVDGAFASFSAVPSVQPSRDALLDFIYDRLRGYLRDQGYTANQVAAVVDARPDIIADLPARLAAVQAFEALPEAKALASANKRIVNILKKSGAESAAHVDPALLVEPAERDLHRALATLAPAIAADCDRGAFGQALTALAAAKPAIDRFFDDVMVMADDRAVRANRLALLNAAAATMNRVADIGKLA
jgi:glycyl-tRNA synthetase beta chain